MKLALFGKRSGVGNQLSNQRNSCDALAISVTSIQEARRFDEYLVEYQKTRQATPDSHVSFEHIFPVLKDHPEKGRLFAYFVELQLQHALLNCDLCDITTLLDSNSPLTGSNEFCYRVSLSRLNSDFIFRYRAIWDKIMAIIILLRAPERFQKFTSAKSRKKCFSKIANETGRIPQDLVDHIIDTTTAFDEKYRTEEAHGSGSARKWSTGNLPEDDESEQIDMFWAWNALNTVMAMLGSAFRVAANNRAT